MFSSCQATSSQLTVGRSTAGKKSFRFQAGLEPGTLCFSIMVLDHPTMPVLIKQRFIATSHLFTWSQDNSVQLRMCRTWTLPLHICTWGCSSNICCETTGGGGGGGGRNHGELFYSDIQKTSHVKYPLKIQTISLPHFPSPSVNFPDPARASYRVHHICDVKPDR